MQFERATGLSKTQPEQKIIQGGSVPERGPSETTLEAVVEWVAVMEHHFLSTVAPFQGPLKELREKYPEAAELITRVETAVRHSASQASVAARTMAKIDDATWNEGVRRAYG